VRSLAPPGPRPAAVPPRWPVPRRNPVVPLILVEVTDFEILGEMFLENRRQKVVTSDG
jgi:hypothetical protein